MKCKKCGKEFEKHAENHLYCSRKCRFDSYFERRKLKENNYKNGLGICPYCKQEFAKVRNSRKYCSTKCSRLASRKAIDIDGYVSVAKEKKLDKTLGYVRIYCPLHPKANTWGYVYEHVLIAEKQIGRFLQKNEVVHHRNGKRWDNNPENLEVMDKIEHSKLRGQRPEDL